MSNGKMAQREHPNLKQEQCRRRRLFAYGTTSVRHLRLRQIRDVRLMCPKMDRPPAPRPDLRGRFPSPATRNTPKPPLPHLPSREPIIPYGTWYRTWS